MKSRKRPVGAAPREEPPPAVPGYAVYINLSCDLGSEEEVRVTLDRLAAALPEQFRVKSWTVWSPGAAPP